MYAFGLSSATWFNILFSSIFRTYLTYYLNVMLQINVSWETFLMAVAVHHVIKEKQPFLKELCRLNNALVSVGASFGHFFQLYLKLK